MTTKQTDMRKVLLERVRIITDLAFTVRALPQDEQIDDQIRQSLPIFNSAIEKLKYIKEQSTWNTTSSPHSNS